MVNLLQGQAPPASPGLSGTKGEKILPGSRPWEKGNVKPSQAGNQLSPHAKPFTPAKRLNTTSAVELADREFEISDTDIMVGDDRHGINMEMIGTEMDGILREEDMINTMSRTLVRDRTTMTPPSTKLGESRTEPLSPST